MIGSDTDDTGSSVSTVVDRFSQNYLTHQSKCPNSPLSFSSCTNGIENTSLSLEKQDNENLLNKSGINEINSQSSFGINLDDYDDIQSVSMNYEINKHLDSIVDSASSFGNTFNQVNQQVSEIINSPLMDELSLNKSKNICSNQEEKVVQPLATSSQEENVCNKNKSQQAAVPASEYRLINSAHCQDKCFEKNESSKTVDSSTAGNIKQDLMKENKRNKGDSAKSKEKPIKSDQIKTSRSMLSLSLIPKKLESSKALPQASSPRKSKSTWQINEAELKPSLIPRPIVKPSPVPKTKIPVRRVKSIDNFKSLTHLSYAFSSTSLNKPAVKKKQTEFKQAKIAKKVAVKEKDNPQTHLNGENDINSS